MCYRRPAGAGRGLNIATTEILARSPRETLLSGPRFAPGCQAKLERGPRIDASVTEPAKGDIYRKYG